MRRSRWWALGAIALVLVSPTLAGAVDVEPEPLGQITEFPLPSPPYTPNISVNITVGPDGNLWFTEQIPGKIGRISPDGVVTEFPSPVPGPVGITAGPDGNIWFTALGGAIVKMSTAGAVLDVYAVTTPIGIVAGPDGRLWYTRGFGQARVGAITTTGTTSEVATTSANPNWITVGPDGNLWFTETGADKIGKITTSLVLTEYVVPTANSFPQGIVSGPDGNLWFTEYVGNKIVKVTTSGVFTEYPIPVANTGPAMLAVGPEGDLWVTLAFANTVIRIDTQGNLLGQYTLPTADTGPFGITLGPDENMWVAETQVANIARIGTEAPERDDGDEQARRAATPSPPVLAEPTFTG